MKTKLLSALTLSFMLLLINGCSAEDGNSENTNNTEVTQNKNYIEQNIVQNEN